MYMYSVCKHLTILSCSLFKLAKYTHPSDTSVSTHGPNWQSRLIYLTSSTCQVIKSIRFLSNLVSLRMYIYHLSFSRYCIHMDGTSVIRTKFDFCNPKMQMKVTYKQSHHKLRMRGICVPVFLIIQVLPVHLMNKVIVSTRLSKVNWIV